MARPSSHKLKSCIITRHGYGDTGPDERSALAAGTAQAFAAGGHEVTLLWAPEPECKISEADLERARRRFLEESHIDLTMLPPSRDLLPGYGSVIKQSLAVYHYIRDQRFDSVFFSLEGGLGYFSLLARETGVFENPPLLNVIAQSTTEWAAEADKRFLATVDHVAAAYMEKYCAEECDGLISTSHALLAWMKHRKWRVSSHAKVLLPVIPREWRLPVATNPVPVAKGSEIVFFAGTEYHKGLTLLCDALDKAAPDLPRDLTVTMMGGFGRILGEHTGGMLVRRARNWSCELKLLPYTSPQEYLSYVRDSGAFAVFPAYDSGAGYLTAACALQGLPFIATNAGALPELVAAPSRSNGLCDPTPASLATVIIGALSGNPSQAAPSAELEKSSDAWRALLGHGERRHAGRHEGAPRTKGVPLVSVVLVHHDRPNYLLRAVKSVEDQDYGKIELIVVDDGSTLPESRAALDALETRFRKRGWRILREKNKYLGAARNAGARAARGSYILFLDDDNALFPTCVSTLVHAANTSRAKICTSFRRTFYGDDVPAREDAGYIQYITLGGSPDIGFIENTFGDATALIHRGVFKKIGYQVELFGRTGEDWEFFARAVLAGLKLRVVPKPTYWYHSTPDGMLRTSHWHDNQLPTFETYRRHGFKGLDHLHHLALSAHVSRSEAESFRDNLTFTPSNARFLELCDLEPESEEALDMLASIAVTEGRPRTALYLLERARQSGFLAEETAMHLKIKSEIEKAGNEFRAGAPPMRRRAREISKEEFSWAGLITRYDSELPLMLFPPEGGLFLRPSEQGPVVARLEDGFPAFVRRAIGYVEIAHEEASPFEFAMALTRPDIMADWRKDPPGNCIEFSGWKLVEEKFQLHEVMLEIRHVTKMPLDLNLAIRLPKGSTPSPANAYWRKIVLIWDC